MKANKILLVFLIFYVGHIQAQEIQDSVKIYFRQGYSVLEPSHRNNREALDRIADSLRTSYADSVYQLKRIQVVGGASPGRQHSPKQTFICKSEPMCCLTIFHVMENYPTP